MINKYKNSTTQELKEYKVSKVKTGTAKNGSKYTMCQIADAKKNQDGSFSYENYSVFSWQEDVRLEDGDKITFDDITALEVVESEYNGKKTLQRTIFADINVISANPNKVVVEDIPDFKPIDTDTLPF